MALRIIAQPLFSWIEPARHRHWPHLSASRDVSHQRSYRLEPVVLGTAVVTAACGQDNGVAPTLEIEENRLSAPTRTAAAFHAAR